MSNTSAVTATLEQQAALKIFEDFHAALRPAILADTKPNGLILAAEMRKRGLQHSVENLLKVTNDILFTGLLTWVVEPKKLAAQRANAAPEKVVPQVEYERERESKARASEAADAQKKSSDAGYKAARSAVASYQPVKFGRNGSAIDYPEQEATQTLLKKHIVAEEARGVDGQTVLVKVGEYLQGRYEILERRSERV